MASTPVSYTELAGGALQLAVDDQVASITLSRPERRNAVTPAIWHALAEIGASLPERVRVVVVRAEASSAGGSGPQLDEEQIAGYQAGYLWLANPGIVSIAAVQGHAIGAGFQLALACDLRILADDAKFCMK